MLASLFIAAAIAPVLPVLPASVPASDPDTSVSTPMSSPVSAGSVGRPSIGFLSAAALRERCESKSAGLVSYCFAYVVGVHDTVQAYETWLRVREFCAPVVSSQSDMRRAFISYLDKNPGAGSGEAASVIVLALKDQFACAVPEAAQPAKAAPGKASLKGSR